MARIKTVDTLGKNGRRLRLDETSVSSKRVREPGGTVVQQHVLNIDSQTFASDLTYVFGRNVAKARKDNKRVAGVADIEPIR